MVALLLLAISALCGYGLLYFGLGLLAELFAPEPRDDGRHDADASD